MTSESGFTLIEILVVCAITVLIGSFLIANFSRARVDLNQTTLTIADAIREAQASALSGTLFQSTYRCGYGITFTPTSYTIYAGPASDTVECATEIPVFESGIDTRVRSGLLQNNVLEIATQGNNGGVSAVPRDLFFAPPNPTTFIGDGNASSEVIYIRRQGATCPSADCRIITVTTAGTITAQ